jgi:hypothetical protein
MEAVGATFLMNGKVVEAKDFKLEGRVYLDGTCDQHPVRDLKRTAWAVAQVDESGTVRAAAYGPVPSSLPQSSQSGEYSALAAAEHLKTGACRLFGDCENVVGDWNKGNNRAKGSKKLYYRLVEEGRQAATAGNISSFRWVKAHEFSSTRARGDKEEIEMAVGNHHADALADEGNKLHPQASAERKAQIIRDIDHANQACRTIANVLTLWPRLARGSERVARGETGRRMRNADATRHEWIELASGAWHCTQCLSTTRGTQLREGRRNEICKGRPDALSATGRRDLNHGLHEQVRRMSGKTGCRTCAQMQEGDGCWPSHAKESHLQGSSSEEQQGCLDEGENGAGGC